MHNISVLKEYVRTQNSEAIHKKLQEIIPEYIPENTSSTPIETRTNVSIETPIKTS